MIKRFLATLILISMLSSIGSFVPAVYSEENVVYSETFENTSVGELPPNVTSNIGAALGDAGYVAVAENAKACLLYTSRCV